MEANYAETASSEVFVSVDSLLVNMCTTCIGLKDYQSFYGKHRARYCIMELNALRVSWPRRRSPQTFQLDETTENTLRRYSTISYKPNGQGVAE